MTRRVKFSKPVKQKFAKQLDAPKATRIGRIFRP